MSETRHQPSSPVLRSQPPSDTEDDATGVMRRITGEWPIPTEEAPAEEKPEAVTGPKNVEQANAVTPDPVDKPPLPVRRPRRASLDKAESGPANGASGTAEGGERFSYFGSRPSAEGGPRAAAPRTGAPHTTGPHTTGPHRTGPHTTGPHTTGPQVTGPRATGPHATGPQVTGPRAAGLNGTGPQATGPNATGPQAAGAARRPGSGREQTPGAWDRWRRMPYGSNGANGSNGSNGATQAPEQADRVMDRPIPLPAWAQAPISSPYGTGESHPSDWNGESPQEEPQEQPAKKAREPFLDNAKFVLIALVVLGHSLVPTLAADSSRALYVFIYMFHMPLFVTISGYLSRNFWNSNAKTNKLVDTFLVPYVIIEVAYAAVRTALGHKWSITIVDPAWLNWYLIALLFWRLSTPVWKRMRFPLAAAVVVYLFSGLSELPGDFSMDRFFGLLPFFVLGLVIKPEWFEFLRRNWVRAVSALVLVGAAAVAVYLVKNYSVKLGPFYWKNSYHDLGQDWWEGMTMRLIMLAASLAMCAAVMSLIPRRETWFSDLGTRTLYCYLLHGIPVLIAKEMGWLGSSWLFGPLGVAAIACSAFALAIVLCLPVTRSAFQYVLEPRLSWLYRRPNGPAEPVAAEQPKLEVQR